MADKEWSLPAHPSSFPDRPLTILSPCSAVRGHREFTPSVAHGDSHPDPPCREAEGKISRPKRNAGRFPGDQSQNHTASARTRSLTIEQSSECPKASTCKVTDDFPDTREFERKLEQQVRKSCSHCRDCHIIPTEFVLRPAPYLAETMVEPSLPTSRVGAAAVPDSNAADDLFKCLTLAPPFLTPPSRETSRPPGGFPLRALGLEAHLV